MGRKRPSLDEIKRNLSKHEELGVFESRFESSKKWKNRTFKIVDKKLFIFLENETKAEKVLNLADCKWMIGGLDQENCYQNDAHIAENPLYYVHIENKVQMNCSLRSACKQKVDQFLQTLKSFSSN
eukprot:TRINITY_DN12362_c0_g1_i1.p1 TRINITY_DN12362_c0_g1~~TRINITY_DN12362_c0_g1_i1.p1  ORF type:complete len:126 (-),score=16.14 TRINITY_DN12362_c0_g1_i1:146-523(-)